MRAFFVVFRVLLVSLFFWCFMCVHVWWVTIKSLEQLGYIEMIARARVIVVPLALAFKGSISASLDWKSPQVVMFSG